MAANFQTGKDMLPWPECLGTFDEESCRFFLRELGQKVVQAYPFSVGMEEVFNGIIDRYGFEGSADVLGVLQELLEDESTAAGVGDDGDIWRSWRHSWRHRNDDTHNPYLPRAYGKLLPPPSSTRIRLLRTANFITEHLTAAKREYQQVLHSIILDPADFPIRQHSRTESCPVQPEAFNSSLQDFASNEAFEERPTLPSPDPGSILENSDSVSPQRLLSASSRKHNFPFNLVSPRRRISIGPGLCRRSQNTGDRLSTTNKLNREGWEAKQVLSEETSDSCSPKADALGGRMNRESDKTPVSQRILRVQENRHSLPSDVGSTEIEATPNKRRAVHREARMIDGALFQGLTRKEKVFESQIIDTRSPVKAAAEASSKRLSWHSTQHSPRQSWLHNVLTRFHNKPKQKSKQPKLAKQHPNFGNCSSSGLQRREERSFTTQETASICEPEMRQITSHVPLGFDGAEDDRNNKPLPSSPAEQSSRPSLQSETQRIFFDLNADFDIVDCTTSATPLYVIRSEEKADLRSLVSATMSGPQELATKDSDFRYRLSSSSSRSGLSSPKSFTTLARQNPYHDSNETPSLTSTPAPLAYRKNGISSAVWPFRNSAVLSNVDVADQEQGAKRPGHVPGQNTAMQQKCAELDVMEVERRGRRPKTPPKSLSKSKTDSETTPPSKNLRARSRSPVKKLIGMVKSMSTNQLPDDLSPPKTSTPASTSQGKWKELSHKLRHGFLTADLEQLEKEDLMEQYASENRQDERVRIITPPSSNERTMFPVSIRSSGQSKLWSELEYMLIESCNSFLKDELAHDRISRDSILRIKRQWQARHRPQVVEFYYDQATQYDLIITNLRTVKLYSDYSQNAIMLNSVLHQWKILIRELSAKTLCMPDSIVRRWLHDGRRVLELLGASQITLANMDKLTTLCMAVIGSAEKERARQRNQSKLANTQGDHRRSASDSSTATLHKHEQALLRARQPTPSLMTPTSSATASSRKMTRPELSREQRFPHRNAETRVRQGPNKDDTQQFVFKHGGGPSHDQTYNYQYPQSLRPAVEHARLFFD